MPASGALTSRRKDFRFDGDRGERKSTSRQQMKAINDAPSMGVKLDSLSLLQPGVAAPPPPGQEPAVQVRSDFRSTIPLAAGRDDGCEWRRHSEGQISGFTNYLAGDGARRHHRKSIRHRQRLNAHEATAHRAAPSAALLCRRRSGDRLRRLSTTTRTRRCALRLH